MRRSLEVRSYGSRRRSTDVPAEPRRAPGRKDTRRWCGGKIGREHVKAWRRGSLPGWSDLACEACGKRFAYCYAGSPLAQSLGVVCICGTHRTNAVPA